MKLIKKMKSYNQIKYFLKANDYINITIFITLTILSIFDVDETLKDIPSLSNLEISKKFSEIYKPSLIQ